MMQGADHVTTDLDVLPVAEESNLARLGAAMTELGARLRVSGLSDEEAKGLPATRAVHGRADDVPVRLAHLADVIASKEHADRDKDREVLPTLRILLTSRESEGQNE